MIDVSTVFSGIAIIVSFVTLVSSTYLAVRQARLQNRANHIDVFVQLMNEFRDVTFHDKFRYVVSELQIDHPPELGLGIFELPEPARGIVVNIAYYFQNCAAFIGHGLLDEERIVAMLHVRFISVWRAIEPYVLAERQKNLTTGKYLLTSLERLATYAASKTEDQAVAIYKLPPTSGTVKPADTNDDPNVSQGSAK